MRRRINRKVSANTAAAGEHAAWIGGLVVLAGIMAIVNVLANTTCNQLQASIGEKEKQLVKLQEQCQREYAQLASLLVPRKLSIELNRRGMAMNVTQPYQIVKMSRSGRPYPESVAVIARARGASAATATASYSGAQRRRK